MAREDFGAHGAVVRGQIEVSALIKDFGRKARPAAVDLAAAHASAEHEHDIAVTVVGAAVAVFPRGTAKLGHGYQNDVLHPIAQILIERRKPVAEFFQAIGQLPGGAAFGDMGVPALDFSKGDLESDIGFDQPGDCFSPTPNLPTG